MNKHRYPKERVNSVYPNLARIENQIGRRWWLGKNLWEFLDSHREWYNHKFFSRKSLREFNIKRKRRGWSLNSPIQRRKEFQNVIK